MPKFSFFVVRIYGWNVSETSAMCIYMYILFLYTLIDGSLIDIPISISIFYKQWCSGVHASMIASNRTTCILSTLQSQATTASSSSSVLIKNPISSTKISTQYIILSIIYGTHHHPCLLHSHSFWVSLEPLDTRIPQFRVWKSSRWCLPSSRWSLPLGLWFCNHHVISSSATCILVRDPISNVHLGMFKFKFKFKFEEG